MELAQLSAPDVSSLLVASLQTAWELAVLIPRVKTRKLRHRVGGRAGVQTVRASINHHTALRPLPLTL